MLYRLDIAPPTSMLLVFNHRRFLGLENKPQKWNFIGITDELNNWMLTDAVEQHILVSMAFPDISLNDVDVFSLLEWVGAFSDKNGFSVELIVYKQSSMGPSTSRTLINSHNPSTRRVTVQLMTAEVISNFSLGWHAVLDELGIKPKLPARGNAYASPYALLSSGYSVPDLPHVSAVTPVGNGQMVVANYPKNGRVARS